MAELFQVPGPMVVRYGGTTIGSTDGQTGIDIAESSPQREIITDATGGVPEDYIQQRGHVIVSMALVKWDDAAVDEAIAAIAGNSTFGSPSFATPGNVGTVGMLRIGDGGFRELTLTPTKPRASDGGHAYTFPRAFRDPEQDTELRGLLAAGPATRILTFRCMPDASGNCYTRADVT